MSWLGWRAAVAAVSREHGVQLAAPALALIPMDMGWQHAVSPWHQGALRRDPQAARGYPASALEVCPGLAPSPFVSSSPGIWGLEEGPFPTHPPLSPQGGQPPSVALTERGLQAVHVPSVCGCPNPQISSGWDFAPQNASPARGPSGSLAELGYGPRSQPRA